MLRSLIISAAVFTFSSPSLAQRSQSAPATQVCPDMSVIVATERCSDSKTSKPAGERAVKSIFVTCSAIVGDASLVKINPVVRLSLPRLVTEAPRKTLAFVNSEYLEYLNQAETGRSKSICVSGDTPAQTRMLMDQWLSDQVRSTVPRKRAYFDDMWAKLVDFIYKRAKAEDPYLRHNGYGAQLIDE